MFVSPTRVELDARSRNLLGATRASLPISQGPAEDEDEDAPLSWGDLAGRKRRKMRPQMRRRDQSAQHPVGQWSARQPETLAGQRRPLITKREWAPTCTFNQDSPPNGARTGRPQALQCLLQCQAAPFETAPARMSTLSFQRAEKFISSRLSNHESSIFARPPSARACSFRRAFVSAARPAGSRQKTEGAPSERPLRVAANWNSSSAASLPANSREPPAEWPLLRAPSARSAGRDKSSPSAHLARPQLVRRLARLSRAGQLNFHPPPVLPPTCEGNYRRLAFHQSPSGFPLASRRAPAAPKRRLDARQLSAPSRYLAV